MDNLLQSVAAFVTEHQSWAGLILGALTFAESLVLIGAFVPATALMLLAGTLIGGGVLDPFEVLAWCTIGAVLGDAVSYALGRRLGPRVLRIPAFRDHRRTIARTRLFNRRFGVASIFIGRFFGPLRAFVPIMAGILQMKWWTFQTANLLSAVVWIASLLAPGYLAARSLSGVSLELGLAIAAGVALTVLGAFLGLRFAASRRSIAAAKAKAASASAESVAPIVELKPKRA
ncbi:DedA family protein [Caulobacter endophyticus]|uniref:DedA family protein n=1 Tax=Caulobacter endophyticus TaxID=2172652 RepID=UPI00240ECC42|nr:DedA family protein [Caulobacter endophyticus]MDG2529076.1 DedA family protein [Caulobacter endophyticus]